MIRILGIRVDEYDMQQSLDQVEAFIAAGAGLMHQVITLNPEGVWLAQSDQELSRVIERAALVTPDGNGLLWAAKRLGRPLKERVAGIDLLERLCELAAMKRWSVYLLGAKTCVADSAASLLVSRYPGLTIAGCDNGYFRGREEQAVAAVRQSGADILFAALGMPYQEKWLDQHRDKLGCKVAVGVGGSFDVLAGTVRRAPTLWQHLKLEWLWRLLADPRRWKRYLAIPKFMRAVRREARILRKERAAGGGGGETPSARGTD